MSITAKRKGLSSIPCFSFGFVSLHNIHCKTNPKKSLKSNLNFSDNKANPFFIIKF